VAQISERPWEEVRDADYEDADEYCRASLIDLNPKGEEKTKERCKLPVREPKSKGGKLNRNAVHAAAVVLAGGRGGVDAPTQAKRKAARELVRLYRDLDEEPPDSLTKLAKPS
jgi:hypothetical protein